ncbi:MAG: hypothetical protein U5M50_04215 [Sphingobium sp.]|nr:hypothetical protein [Sphingobium sp.]
MKVVVGGQDIDLGVTEGSPVIAITDYSRRVTDDFGVTTVVRRGFSRRMSVRLAVASDAVDALQRQLADLRATSALWVAGEDLDSLSVEGFYKDFSVDLAVPPVSFCTLSIEGLVEADAGADAAGDPAPDGQASTLRLLTPQAVTDAVLTGSNVAEDDHPQWSSLTTYAAGDRVLRTVSHRVFESAAAGNVGNDPLGASGQWIDIGPTNRWAMFDQALGTLTTRNGSISVSLAPVAPIDAIALLDVTGASIRVQAPAYDVTKPLTDGATGATFADIPSTSETVLITITGTGAVSIGTLLIGTLRGLGITEASPSVGIIDFSKKDVDDFGDVTLVERAWAKRMSVKALIATDAVDVVMQRLAAVRGFPALWIGEDAFESLTLYGFYKDASITLDQAVSTLTLNVEGFSKAAGLSPLKASDVAFEDGKTVEQLKPAEPGATEGMTPAEREEVDQLAGTVVDLDAAVAAAQSQIAAIEGSIGDIDAPALRDDIAALQTQAAGIIGSIGDIGTQVDQVETSVSTLSGSVSILSQTVTNLNGTVSTLSSTVATQGGQISTIAQSVTTLSGTLSTLNTIVSASSNPNLLPNGGFENGLRGWNNSSSTPVANAWFRAVNAAWGTYAAHFTPWVGQTSEAYGVLESDTISGLDVGSFYTVAADADIRPNGQIGAWAAIQIKWITSGSPIYTDIINPVAIPQTGIGFSESGSERAAFKLTRQVPAGTTGLTVRLITSAPQGVQINSMAWRQVKLERGQIATPYSGEATAGQVFTAYSDLNSSFASLSTTVSAQGATISQNATAISTLQGQQSSLSTTVSTQGAAITTLQTTTSTLQGDTATLRTQVTAGSPNLLRNGGFELGNMNYWSWSAGAAFDVIASTDTWGVFAVNNTNIPDNSVAYIYSNPVGIERDYYTLTADTGYFLSGGTGHVYLQMDFLNVTGGYISSAYGPGVASGNNFSADGSTRRAIKLSALAPEGATQVRSFVVWYKASGVVQSMHVRQVKLERGQVATPYSAEASVRQSFEALSTLTSQYASLSSTVSTLNSSVSVQQTAITNLQGKTAAWWQVQAIAGSDRASAQLFAGGGFAGFDIVGDLRVTGNALIGGTVNPEALALDRFVKRIYGTGSGSPAAGQTLLLYAQDIGVTTANGSYQIELAGEMTTTVGRQTSTLGGLPYYINHNADGGLRIVINKNGSTIYQTDIHASEYITANDVGPKVYSLNRNIVVDSPGGGDASGGNATILIYAVRGSADSGAVNQGDYYTRDVSATYSGFNIAAKTKWTFV